VRHNLWSAQLYIGRGIANSSLADMHEARTRVEQALLYHPQYLPARRALCGIYSDLSHLEPDYQEKARRYAEETEQWWPGSASHMLGLLAAEDQDEAACQAWLQKSLIWGRAGWRASLETAPELDPYRDHPWLQDLLTRW
jgi:hypothetical protein